MNVPGFTAGAPLERTTQTYRGQYNLPPAKVRGNVEPMLSTYECGRVWNGVPTIDRNGNYVCCIRNGPNNTLGTCLPITEVFWPYPRTPVSRELFSF